MVKTQSTKTKDDTFEDYVFKGMSVFSLFLHTSFKS